MISIHPHEADAATSQSPQRDPDWQQAYRAHRPRGTQDQPLHRAALGRTQSPMPRPGPHPHRRPHPSRRDQPRPPRHPRPAPRTQRLGHRLTPAPTHRPADKPDRLPVRTHQVNTLDEDPEHLEQSHYISGVLDGGPTARIGRPAVTDRRPGRARRYRSPDRPVGARHGRRRHRTGTPSRPGGRDCRAPVDGRPHRG